MEEYSVTFFIAFRQKNYDTYGSYFVLFEKQRSEAILNMLNNKQLPPKERQLAVSFAEKLSKYQQLLAHT